MMEALKKIFKQLELTKNNGLFFLKEDDWKMQCQFPERVINILEQKIKPDAFFYFNGKPLLLFFDNPTDLDSLHKQVWNFNQTPIIFVNLHNEIHIYNGFNYIKKGAKFELEKIDAKNLNDFSFWQLVTGQAWEKHHALFDGKNRVDQKLLDNIKAVRATLIQNDETFMPIANKLIGRILFIRYLIDRKVRIAFGDMKNREWTNEDLCAILEDVNTTYELFDYLRGAEGYNGDMFPLEKNEQKRVQSLKPLINLLKGIDISTGQLSLFDVYDFSIIPIELISNVYEFFIGKKNQSKKSAYYTPLFLTDYILNETVATYFEQEENLQNYNCQVLDPACGSGIFLVEALRKIILQYKKIHLNCEENKENYHEKLRELLKNNIHGIDIDESAIDVAVFSLYITLLDFIKKPADIESFKFPKLLNTNFFKADFFDKKASFNAVFKEKAFDFIIGNPPWGDLTKNDPNALYVKYWKDREKLETKKLKEKTANKKSKVEIRVSKKEIAQAFLIRTNDFSSVQTKCALIVTSKILYDLYANKFRKYFLENNLVQQIFELSSVRHQIFDKSNDKAVAPASIIFYQAIPKGKRENYKNLVRHISLKPHRLFELFKIFIIEKYDDKEVPQYLFMQHDWLWKTLVYGNILDYHFVKRLKELPNVYDIISDESKFVFGKGVGINGSGTYDIEHLKKITYGINTKKQHVKHCHILYSENFLKKLKTVHRATNQLLYKAPFLLIKKGATKDFKIVSALSLKDAVFTDTLTSIKALTMENMDVLRQISGIFYSNLFAYYLLTTASSIGIEREQVHDKKEKFSFPYVNNDLIAQTVAQIEIIKKDLYNFRQKNDLVNLDTTLKKELALLEQKETQLLVQLEEEVYQAFELSEQERDLINYALEVSIPSLKQKKQYLQNRPLQWNETDKNYLKNYASIIAHHYDVLFRRMDKCIETHIYYSKYVIAVEFCVVNKQVNQQKYHFHNDVEATKILLRFAKMSYQQLSKKLFIQKDIKGFETESFYVIKPNEFKCWHRAIAHLDLGNFIDALMKAGAEVEFEKNNPL